MCLAQEARQVGKSSELRHCSRSQLQGMKCFSFLHGEKRDEIRIPKWLWPAISSFSSSGETKRSDSDFTSRNTSETSTGSSTGRANFPMIPPRSSKLREFTFSELKSATKNFSRNALVGEGGFGCVYKGIIKSTEDSSKKLDVAVKQLGQRGFQGHKEWVAEVNILGVVKHPNLVKLFGYCADDDERGIRRLLVYEYMQNGSVDDHLSPRSGITIPWLIRLRIARDTARALAYLHEEMDFQIIFRDFKSSNILLDEQWNAKLSDFGLARLGPAEGSTHVSTMPVGTIGYASPEYIRTCRLTSKNDVWSYGVFLYELITGRRPLDYNRPKNEQNLLEWVRPYLSDPKKFQLVMDPRLERKSIAKSAWKLATIANRCLVQNPKSRPMMSQVRVMVDKIVEASEAAGGHESQLRSFTTVKISGDIEPKNKKRAADRSKLGDIGWLRRLRTFNAIKTC
ncbi:hypothetical protein SAY87_018996 [Trapa incisa]|uniref:non-specific serine/threonine protein kinase n=1 Tax=Trapa incisa TaxID=236973 RepID=A0AAN7JZ56_9MYRT|nr:hypothetical protein SAY87_018996 [Trapa incisa]